MSARRSENARQPRMQANGNCYGVRWHAKHDTALGREREGLRKSKIVESAVAAALCRGSPKPGEETPGRLRGRVELDNITNWDELAERADRDPKELARLCGVSLRRAVSLRTLERFLQRTTNMTPEAFLMRKLHERCLADFERGMSVKEVANKAHFVDQFTFSRSFKKYMGVPPSAFRLRAE